MLKFEVNATELRKDLEKAATITSKYSPYIRLYIGDDKVLRMFTSNIESKLEVDNDYVSVYGTGEVYIQSEDIKVIPKSGMVTIEDISTSDSNKVNIRCEKKSINIAKYEASQEELYQTSKLNENKTEQYVSLPESWLLETITKMLPFTSKNSQQLICQVFNFNTKLSRVEVIDGCRYALRSFEAYQDKIVTQGNTMIHYNAVPVLKKVIDKKSNELVTISQDDKHVEIQGKNFRYVLKRIEANYIDLERFEVEKNTSDYDHGFIADKNNMIEVLKYYCDLSKLSDSKAPVMFHSKDDKLFTYYNNKKYELSDEITAKYIHLPANLFIGLNPHYLLDAFNVVDKDEPLCSVRDSRSAIYLSGNEYHFMLLPVRITDNDTNNMNKQIGRMI